MFLGTGFLGNGLRFVTSGIEGTVEDVVVEVAALEGGGVGVISVTTDGGGKPVALAGGPNFDGFLTFGESLKIIIIF